MITRVALVDGLTPAVAAWIQDLNPASGRALLKLARVIRRTAVANINTIFRRTGQHRTSFREFTSKTTGRQRVKIPTRGIRIKLDQAAGIRTVRVWHGSGILAAHELGATIPPTDIRLRTRRGYRIWHRRAFTLPKRRTLIPAYESHAGGLLAILEAEYQTLLNQAPPAVRS